MSRYSVVIPAYNAAGMVSEAVRSVLGQTIPPERVIVVDDGSRDATAVEVEAIGGRVELVRQQNAGPGAATTRGMALVETPFLATLDADDLWLPDKIERQFAVLGKDPDLAGVFGQLVNFKSDPASADYARRYDGWSRTTMLIQTEVAHATGPIIDPVGAGDMVDWIARLREGGHRLQMLDSVLALRRVHAASMTYGGRHQLTEGYMSVVRAAMARRRGQNSKGTE